ncbi:serine/arginine repetitive matrix protein 1-like isoform X2 [Osmia bicornis bicornis]|uniref:serine/arginine repetitive matrix protein 1-like isoform X2 n=1 Tax=Osmia bicornis bicornis TaxID=1437191 RepID=UPI001EAEFE9C|nr:serine/arginine repetitive matrix protein 1-like isoform X2 [Osmia bicornis bicornis]
MQVLDLRVGGNNSKFCSNCNSNKMDYRQKMIIPSQQNTKNDDEDDEDLEALRLAALQSLRTKDPVHNKKQSLPQVQKIDVTQTFHPLYKGQRPLRRGYYHNRIQQRQNGNLYYQSPRNPNLIAIVPMDDRTVLQQADLTCSVEKTDTSMESYPTEVSKFHRFKDHGSGSDEEDNKEQKNTIKKEEMIEKDGIKTEPSSEVAENQEEIAENLIKTEEDKPVVNDDDDDILLMADLEEEDSLERLMDEMEREMNVDKPSEKKEKRSSKRESKESIKKDDAGKNTSQKNRTEDGNNRKDSYTTASTVAVLKSERRSISPHVGNRIPQKRRSLSPRSRPRKKSPRRSPRRSPARQLKKSQREISRYRSPRKSPVRYSPRSRSPKMSSRSRSPRLSPRRSPNKSPIRRSPIKKLSPRGRSPRLSPHSRSPRPIRSPKISSAKSPRLTRSRSPKFSPLRLSPQSRSPIRTRSPKMSPKRTSPLRRLSPKSRSPGLSPRRGTLQLPSPKISPRRISPRARSPRLSPRRSPWSSPRNSPRLSPRRKRSPRWSPKESCRKHGPRSVTPDGTGTPSYAKESSPAPKGRISPEANRVKSKQKEENFEKVSTTEKESTDVINDPVLEARRRKFECTRPIDPINANKKIKLSKKENTSKKVEFIEGGDLQAGNVRKVTEEYEVPDNDLCLEFEEFDESMENTSPVAITSSVNTCVELESQKTEKEKSSKKKKKRDKELYQVGKLKNELPLSERIGKDKKCKKRKDVVSDGPSDDVDAIFEDIAVDEESDLRTELSRRRAERLNRTVPIQSARLVQSAFKGVVNEVVKNNAKANQRHLVKADDKTNQKEVRRVTVLHRPISDLHDSEDEGTLDSKMPVRFRLGLNKQVHDTRESKVSRKASKRQGRKKHNVHA